MANSEQATLDNAAMRARAILRVVSLGTVEYARDVLNEALATHSPSRGEMGTPITRCDNPLCECNRAASIAPGTRTVPCGCGCGRLLREDETENNEWSFVAPGTEEGEASIVQRIDAYLDFVGRIATEQNLAAKYLGRDSLPFKLTYEDAEALLSELRSSRRREEETRADVRRLEFCFSVAMVLTLPVEDGSIGDGFRIASREDLDAQIRRCDDYHMYDYRKAAR